MDIGQRNLDLGRIERDAAVVDDAGENGALMGCEL
jgi:hypothetical protein